MSDALDYLGWILAFSIASAWLLTVRPCVYLARGLRRGVTYAYAEWKAEADDFIAHVKERCPWN